MVTIENDEQCYERWIADNPTGFILNVPTGASRGPFVLHLATCSHIAPAPGWNYTGNTQLKVCSQRREDLLTWSQQRRGTLQECRDCNP